MSREYLYRPHTEKTHRILVPFRLGLWQNIDTGDCGECRGGERVEHLGVGHVYIEIIVHRHREEFLGCARRWNGPRAMVDEGCYECSGSKMSTAIIGDRVDIDLAGEGGASIVIPKGFIGGHIRERKATRCLYYWIGCWRSVGLGLEPVKKTLK